MQHTPIKLKQLPRRHPFWTIALLLLTFSVHADDNYATQTQTEAKWVNATGEWTVANITPEEAREMALARARRRAVESALGVKIDAARMTLDGVMQASFILATHNGRIVEEQILIDEKIVEDGEIIYRVSLKAKVVKEEGRRDSGFRVGLKLNHKTFRVGDEMVMSVTPTRDCYLHVFNFLSDNAVQILHPAHGKKPEFVKAGQTLVLPSEAERRGGKHLRVGLLPGKTEDTEQLLVIATKTDVPFIAGDPKRLHADAKVFAGRVVLPTYTVALEELNRWLVGIPLDQRAFRIVAFGIKKR